MGLSFGKVLLLLLLGAAVWAGIVVYRRMARQRELNEAATRNAPLAAIKTVACPVCGTFVPEKGARRCERGDCPL
jgi:hypothetical protein